MRDIGINAQTLNVTLGRAGENEVSRLVMDASDWEREFPGGSLAMFMERPDGTAYNAAVERQEAAWVHLINAADTITSGRGRIQMQWILNQQIARSHIVGVIILPSIENLSEPPEPPEEGYLEQMAAIGAQATKDAQAAGASAESAEQSARQVQNDAEAAAQSAKQAQSGAQAAQAAADKLSGLDAEVETLPAGSEATVVVAENKIIYGIPRGDKGEPGKDAPQIDDTQITPDHPWSSLKTVDALCRAFTESGNPVVCYPVEGYPLGVAASWAPHQEGTGDPSPDNVRPITGMESVSVTRCGDSYFDFSSADRKFGTYNHTTGIYQDGGTQLATDKYRVIAGSTIINVTNTNYNCRSFYWDISDSYISTELLPPNVEKKIPSNAAWFAVQSGAGGFSDDQSIYLYTGPTYAPYTGTTHTLALPYTIYGGEVDMATGAGSEIWGYIALTGEEQSHVYGKYFYLDFYNEDVLPPPESGTNGICSHYRYGLYADGCIGITSEGKSIVYSPADAYPITQEGLNQWKTYLAAQKEAGTPVQIVYKPASPIPFQATDGERILALAGTNTISTDADNLTVTGRADPIHTIRALSERVTAMEIMALGNAAGQSAE